MKIERDEDGWINIKRIGGVKFVPVTALELQGNEDAEELAGYGTVPMECFQFLCRLSPDTRRFCLW